VIEPEHEVGDFKVVTPVENEHVLVCFGHTEADDTFRPQR